MDTIFTKTKPPEQVDDQRDISFQKNRLKHHIFRY
jgi:hypothetical protein